MPKCESKREKNKKREPKAKDLFLYYTIGLGNNTSLLRFSRVFAHKHQNATPTHSVIWA